jgi:hypothetical protein
MRKRKKAAPEFEAPDLLGLAQRVTRLGNNEIVDQLDVTLGTLIRYIQEWRHSRDADYLGEIALGAQAIYVIAKELGVRQGELLPTQPTRQIKRGA